MRHPARTYPKRDIHASIPENTYMKICTLRAAQNGLFKSMSALIETIIFFARATYNEQNGAYFLFELLNIKASQLESLGNLRELPKSRLVHLTIDTEAVDFLDMLSSQYRVVCHSRSEAVSLILAYAVCHCRSPQNQKHLLQRLETTLSQHPLATASKALV